MKCKTNKITGFACVTWENTLSVSDRAERPTVCKSKTSLITSSMSIVRYYLVPLTETCKLRIPYRICKSGKNFIHLQVFWSWLQDKILTTNNRKSSSCHSRSVSLTAMFSLNVAVMDLILKLLLGQTDMFRKECSCVHTLWSPAVPKVPVKPLQANKGCLRQWVTNLQSEYFKSRTQISYEARLF